MKVMLFFPPNWTPSMPHLALPTLTAYLRGHGVEVIQRDLNLEVFDEVLTRRYLEQSLSKLRAEYGPRGNKTSSRPAAPPRELIQWALNEGPQLAMRVEKARRTLCSPAFFDGPVGLKALQTIMDALRLASLPFYPASLEIGTYNPASAPDSSLNLLHEVRDERFNMLIDIYKRKVLGDIEREQPDVVGISIPSMAQMLPGMTLAAMIKQRGLACHVTVGGPHITMLRAQIAKVPAVFQMIDSAVVFDGEVPLLRLCEALAGGGDLSQVPNLIYRDGTAIRVNARKEPEKIGGLPLPDFRGLPIGKYLAPRQALPLLTARGCYFGKCAFCNVGYGEAENFSLMRSEILAGQMLELQKTYGVDEIFFSDEALTPRTLRELSQIMKREGTPMLWGGCARFEKPISGELLQQMHDGGCRMILYGLETASEAIIERMVKGVKLEHMHRILRESNAAGIWNHTFFFFGFPGETIEDAQQTVNFLFEHKYHVNSAAFGTFLLERDAPAHRSPASFGITRVIEPPEKDLAIYFDYEVSSGMDDRMADFVAERFIDSLPEKPYPQFYVNDVYRFLYACHLSRQGVAPPPWLVPAEEVAG